MNTLLMPGMLFADRFLLNSLVGEGGIGLVWLAEDLKNNHQLVAIKLPKPEYKSQARFIAEAELMAKLNHDHIIKIHLMGRHPDYGEFYVMEYFPDGSLLDFIAHPDSQFARAVPGNPNLRYVPLAQAITFLRPVAQALDYVHQNHEGVLHRDLKLSNILVNQKNGRYVLTDFSLHVGAPSIMSPEQLVDFKGPDDQRQPLDWRSDLFSLGACLYKLTTGSYPIQIMASPDTVQAIDEIYRYQLIDKIPIEPPAQRNPANIELKNEAVNNFILRLTSKSRTARTLNGQITSLEDALNLLGQLNVKKSRGILTPLFAVAVLAVALILLAISLVISSFGPGSSSSALGRATPPTKAVVFITQETLTGYPTATPTRLPQPTAVAAAPTPAAEAPTVAVEDIPTPEATATEALPEETEAVGEITTPEQPEAPPPVCDEGLAFSNPPLDQTVSGQVVFQGTMPQDGLDYYKIEFLPPNSVQWSCCLIDPTYGQINQADLGQWNTADPIFEPGEYGLRLVAVRLDGNFNQCETRVRVEKPSP